MYCGGAAVMLWTMLLRVWGELAEDGHVAVAVVAMRLAVRRSTMQSMVVLATTTMWRAYGLVPLLLFLFCSIF